MLGSVLLFLNIGTPELILILFVALMLFGGEKLPGLARTLGKGIRDFKDASEGVKREINNQIYNYDEKKPELEKTEEPKQDVHTAEAKDTADVAAEHKPLIDTTPVEGTMQFGGHHTQAEDERPRETNIDKPAGDTHSINLNK